MPIEGSGYVAVEMGEVSKLAKVENLRRMSWLIVEAYNDRIQVRVPSLTASATA